MAERIEYDNGTDDPKIVPTTGWGGGVLLIVVLIGILLMALFLLWGPSWRSSGPASSENTATRPAEP